MSTQQRPKTPTQVVAALIWQEGRLLVAQRLATGRCPNLWEFPGGKQEPNESPEQTLVREVQEELGIAVEAGPLAWQVTHDDDASPLALRFYHARPTCGAEPRPICSQQVAWRHPAELFALDFCPADQPLLQLLADAKLRPWPTA